MRTLIEIEDSKIAALDLIAKEEKVSRSALIREAVADLLERRAKQQTETAFGLWSASDKKQDGVIYQRTMRDEW